MSRRLLVVESNTTGTGMLALHVAAALSLRPLFLTRRPDRYHGLADAPAEVVVCETNSLAALESVVDRYAADLAGVTTTSEFYLPAAAWLARRLGTPGNPPAAVRTCRDKGRVRRRLAGNLPQPRFAVVRSSRGVSAAVAAVGLPCVVKPVDDTGSQLVRLCATRREVAVHVARVLAVRTNVRGQRTARRALIEEYLDGPEYSVEMFGHHGTTNAVGICAKSVTGHPYFVECGHVYPAAVPADSAEAMTRLVRSALAALDIGHGPTHTEVKIAPRGPVIVEVNARLAGGMIPELIRLATGVDLIEQQILAAVGEPVRLAVAPRRHAGIRFLTSARGGAVARVSGLAAAAAVPDVVAVSVAVASGDVVAPARSAYQRFGHVLACAATSDAVRTSLDRAAGRMSVRLHPTVRKGQS